MNLDRHLLNISVVSNLLSCQTGGIVRLTGYTSGYISSNDVQLSRSGAVLCPWKIETELGRYINITLYRFEENVNSGICTTLAEITEKETNNPICGEGRREEHVYTSYTNAVQVQFKEGVLFNFGIYFSGKL